MSQCTIAPILSVIRPSKSLVVNRKTLAVVVKQDDSRYSNYMVFFVY